MTKFRLAILSSLLLIGACQCGKDPGPQAVGPEVVTEGTPALSLEGCPVVDANGAPVEGAVPTQGIVTVTNVGRALATLAVTFEGSGADQFSVGEFEKDLPADNSVDIPITFSPRSAAAVNVTMKVDDGDPETELLSVALAGTGLNLPPNPTLKVSVENDPAGSNEYTPCEEGFTCSVDFPSTFFGQAVSKRVRIENAGCATLRIPGLDVTKAQGGGNDLAFVIEQPASLPTEVSPLLLNVADGTQVLDVQLRFAPTDDDAQTEQRRGILTIVSNDPTRPETGELLSLRGEGLRPSFVASPSFCNYSRETDNCGNVNRVPGKATITLSNDGNVPLSIDSATFVNGGSNGRFTLGTDPSGQTLAAVTGTHTFEINYTDDALFVQDELVLTASASGMPAGVVVVSLSGGVPPRLLVEPEPISFEDGGTGSTRTVNLVASPDGGTLTVGEVFMDEYSAGTPNPFFRVTSAPAAGTQILPGNSAPVTVEYTRPASGGSQESTMRVVSNDPGYPAPDHRQVRVYSQTPADLAPTAVLLGPDGETGSKVLTQVDLINGSNTTSLDGTSSSDVRADGTEVPVTAYKFQLVRNDGKLATLVDSAGNSVDGIVQPQGEVTLRFSAAPSSGNRYQVNLYVYDDVGNESAKTSFTFFIQN